MNAPLRHPLARRRAIVRLVSLGVVIVFAALVMPLRAQKSPAVRPRTDNAAIKAALMEQHGEAQRARIDRGVDQAAALWLASDGDLAAFANAHFVADPAVLDRTFARFEAMFESLDGHFTEIHRDARRGVDLDEGPLLPVDPLLGAFDPWAHLTDDLFANKAAFVILLNFPLTTLDERLAQGKAWSRRQWAEARLTARFSRRVPAQVTQAKAKAASDAELYIAQYNVWMHHLVDDQGVRLWPKGLRLITHWNLRDELKAAYADPRALAKQRTIVKVMERIVTQTIPAAVIDNPRLDWNPFTNAVTPAPAAEIEANAAPAPSPTGAAGADLAAREPDTRYRHLLALYHAFRQEDPYAPLAPTAIARAFESGEIPEARVEAMLTEILDSPLVPKVAAEIERRLGRKLEPADLWYAGFKARGALAEADLDKVTQKRYPNAQAFAKDLPRILKALGFSKRQIALIVANVVVDPARGAGHALQAARRGDAARLRTRIEKNGMDYKGYNIAVHEFGHNVEQVFSLYRVDHTLLAGVPITAITEALAFVFQNRDLELLGLAKPSAEARRLHALESFWGAWEIAGVALVDMRVWHWMYDHPNASPAELRAATVSIAQTVWNRWYAPILGQKDSPLLGIYSHMLSSPLYLYNYPLGHLIAFQIEEHLAKQKPGALGAEFERMTVTGTVAPDLWMEQATGAPIGAGPLLRATAAALGDAAAPK
jgi:hypothetical protein